MAKLGLVFVLCFISLAVLEVIRGTETEVETCETTDGVLGQCESARSCSKNGGVSHKENVANICNRYRRRNSFVCCRKPFEIAKELCRSWSSYWSSYEGRCVTSEPLVVGGKEAKTGQFPEIASLGIKTGRRTMWICGGTLLSPLFILTAAHCVIMRGNYIVRLGEHDRLSVDRRNISRVVGPIPRGLHGAQDLQLETRNTAPVEQTVRVQRVIFHPHYMIEKYYDDIALLLLEKPVVLTKRVLPACLPEDPNESFLKRNLTTAGWGNLKFSIFGKMSTTLQKVEIPVIAPSDCDRSLKEKDKRYYSSRGILKTQLCAGAHGKNSCNGDSGGPLVLQENGHCEHTLAGLVSFGHGCGRLSVYTRVSAYLDWITGYVAPKLVPNLFSGYKW